MGSQQLLLTSQWYSQAVVVKIDLQSGMLMFCRFQVGFGYVHNVYKALQIIVSVKQVFQSSKHISGLQSSLSVCSSCY